MKYFFTEAEPIIRTMIESKITQLTDDLTAYVDTISFLINQDHSYHFILNWIQRITVYEESYDLAHWMCSLRTILDRSGNFKEDVEELQLVQEGEQNSEVYEQFDGFSTPEHYEEENNLLTTRYSNSPPESPEIMNPYMANMQVGMKSPQYANYGSPQQVNYVREKQIIYSPPSKVNYHSYGSCRVELGASFSGMSSLPWSQVQHQLRNHWLPTTPIPVGYNNLYNNNHYL